MEKIIFIDRDGILLQEPDDEQVDSLDKVIFPKGMITCMAEIAKKFSYKLVMVTNQDGLGTPSYPENTFWPVHNLLLDVLESVGVIFDEILIDRSFAADNSPYRKPNTGMLRKYLTGNYDLENSFVIGDRWSDMQLAANLGCKGIWLHPRLSDKPGSWKDAIDLKTNTWTEVLKYLSKIDRKAKAQRYTSETKIDMHLNLDGTGISSISTGLSFFDHMLEQIAKHGSIDLFIETKGDLEVDEHHTIEDTAIALGTLISMALGKKSGIQRYGFALPMDDCKAEVLLDFGGRPWLEWDVSFQREYIGDLPTEMIYHFFKSFADHAKCNLSITAQGTNEHHKVEAIFKALAKAINSAKMRDLNNFSIPSTKGIL